MKKMDPNQHYSLLKDRGLTGFEELSGKLELNTASEGTVTASLFVIFRDLSCEKDKSYPRHAWAMSKVFPEDKAERYREIMNDTVRKEGMSQSSMTSAAIRMMAEPGGELVMFSEDLVKDEKLTAGLKDKSLLKTMVDEINPKTWFFHSDSIDSGVQKTMDHLKWRMRYKTECDEKPRMSESWKKYFEAREVSSNPEY